MRRQQQASAFVMLFRGKAERVSSVSVSFTTWHSFLLVKKHHPPDFICFVAGFVTGFLVATGTTKATMKRNAPKNPSGVPKAVRFPPAITAIHSRNSLVDRLERTPSATHVVLIRTPQPPPLHVNVGLIRTPQRSQDDTPPLILGSRVRARSMTNV